MEHKELEQDIKEGILTVTEEAKQTNIIDQASYEAAADFLKGIKTLIKEIKYFFEEPIRKAYEAHKSIKAKEKEKLEPVEAAERLIKWKMSEYHSKEDERRREEERKLQEEARKKAKKEAEDKQAEADFLAEITGETAEKIEVQVPEVKIEAPKKVDGVSYVTIWKFRIVDESLLPREFLVPDEKKIRDKVIQQKDMTNIPGIEVYSAQQVRARS
jgi:hypothetical protein